MTPVEYLEARYGNSVRGLIAVSGILIKFIDLGIKLFAISIVVHVVTGWEVVPVIVVSGLITIAYVFIGGLWATVLTDLVQFVVQLVMSLAVLFIVPSIWWEAGTRCGTVCHRSAPAFSTQPRGLARASGWSMWL